MKKILLAVGLMFASVCAFANVEIDVNLYGMGKALTFETTDKVKGDINQSFAFGFEDDFNFFFGSSASKFDAGLGFFINCDFFKKAELKVNGRSSADYEGNGFNMEFGIGPVFRITFANPFSLYIRPTLGFDFFYVESDDIKETTSSGRTTTYKERIAEFDILKFDVNIGGRSWLLNVDGFHLGIDYGAILGFGGGFGAFSDTSSSSNSDGFTSADVDFKIYVGLCMNFGDRGFDR